jgi:phage terminase Nu1 subunit (DNA packaging protein)
LSEQTAPVAAVAKICNVTDRRIQQLAKEGIIPKPERGRYPLIRCVTSYIQYLQARLDGIGTTAPNIEDAKARKIAAEARLAEIELANAEFETIAIKDHAKVIENIAEIIKAKLISLPTLLAPTLAMETNQAVCQSNLEEHVHATLGELARILSDNRERAEGAKAISKALPTSSQTKHQPVGGSRKATKSRSVSRTRSVAK